MKLNLKRKNGIISNGITVLLFLFSILLLTTSCGTIIGGSKYNATIEVINNPYAKISYQGEEIGIGTAQIKVRRKDADKVRFYVQEDNKAVQYFQFSSRETRWGAVVGNAFLGFGFYYSLVTYGIDLLTGGLWKPDTYEKGIRKINFNHYVYSLNYTPTENKNSTINTRVTLYLKSGTILNGKIIEISNSNLIKFETELGNVFIINQEDIERKEFK